MTKVPGWVSGISKKRLKSSRERDESAEPEALPVELPDVQYFGHSWGEHFVRLVAGSLVVGAADVDVRAVDGVLVVAVEVEIGDELLRAVLASFEDAAAVCRSTKMPGAVGMDNANWERRSKDKLALERNF